MEQSNSAGECNDGYVNETNLDNGEQKVIEPSANENLKKSIKLPSFDRKSEKFSILKNVIIISFAFMLNFTAFNSMANLQSSINKQLGTTSLWVVYASMVFSCAFIPSWLIKNLKVKWTLPICMLCYSTYIAAQFYPRYYTLVPTAFLLGLGAAPMWSAKCTYLTQVGTHYGNIVGEKSEVIITRFFGIFFLFFQSSQVWGNLISSTILSKGIEQVNRSQELLNTCGANFCPIEESNREDELTTTTSNATVVEDENQNKIITIASVYLACSLLSVIIIALLVDPLSRYDVEETLASTKTGKKLIMASFTHMYKINQILIIPLTMWSGFEQAFLGADFTAAYVTCGLGVHMVGYVLICYGVCDAVSSLCFSPLVKKVGRIPIVTFGALLNVVIFIIMLHWTPNPDNIIVFFIIAACWGIADAIWQTQIIAFYGVIFPGDLEPAFSNYRLWESLGFIFAYVWSGTICVNAKIYILFVVLGLGMTGYYTVEYLERKGGLKHMGKTIHTIKDF